MDDFASTALYNLIAIQLRKLGMNTQPSTRFAGKTDRADKTQLLNDALQSLSASALVEIGQGIHALQSEPTLAVLLRASTPTDLLERWRRLERYYHGKHRVKVITAAADRMTLEHYSTHQTPPTSGEDLVIAGLLAALLQGVGCRGLSLSIGSADDCFIRDDQVQQIAIAPPQTATWHFHWQSFERRLSSAAPSPAAQSIKRRLAQLIGDDLGCSWRVSSAAQMLGISTRSLQRSLQREGTSFQQLLRTVRAERLAELITNDQLQLTAIGYSCGFADQAHFSRDFKQRFNMSPSEFAEIAKTT